MCGSDTLAMLVSSTSMNVASVTVMAMIHGLTAGRQAAASFIVIDAAPITVSNSCFELRAARYERTRTRSGCSKPAARSSQLFNPHLRLNRHPRAEFMVLDLALVEHDLHRNALHDFHVVAGGVFGRQQAEALSAGAGHGINVPLVGLAGRIDLNLSRLSRLHLGKLRLLEVCRDPDIRFIERDDLHHLLPGLHILTDLDGAVADRPADRRNHLGVLKVEFSLV